MTLELTSGRAARVLIAFDSVSPVLASAKFRKRNASSRQKMKADLELASKLKLEDEHSTVAWFWIRSHLHNGINEAVDFLAEGAHENASWE